MLLSQNGLDPLSFVLLDVPQAHLNQLLRYYGKITGKFLPQGYAKFRKISTDPEKDDKQDELGTSSISTAFTCEFQKLKKAL